MLSRWLAFVVWALLGAMLVAWVLQMAARPSAVPPHAVAVDTTSSPRSDLTRLLGSDVSIVEAAAPVAASSRFKLVGLVAAPSPAAVGRSLALIAVDGKPAKAVHVGAVIDGESRVLAVRSRAVDIGPEGGPVALTLELPALPAAATGTLPLGTARDPAPPPIAVPTAAETTPPADGSEPAQGVPPIVPQPVAPQSQQPVAQPG